MRFRHAEADFLKLTFPADQYHRRIRDTRAITISDGDLNVAGGVGTQFRDNI